MRWIQRALQLAMVFGLAACAASAQSLPERLLVKPRPGVSIEKLDELLRAHGARRVDVIRQINVHVVELSPGADAKEVAKRLERNPDIEFVEVDEKRPPASS